MMKQLGLMKEVLLVGEVLVGGWWEVLVASHLEYI